MGKVSPRSFSIIIVSQYLLSAYTTQQKQHAKQYSFFRYQHSIQKMKVRTFMPTIYKFFPFLQPQTATSQHPPQEAIAPLITVPLRNNVVLSLYKAFRALSFSKSTLYLAIGILDKLLSDNLPLNEENCDLITGSLILMCTKFNEVYPVQVKGLNRLFNTQYSLEEYVETEALFLHKLDFNLYLENTLYEELSILQASFQGLQSHMYGDVIQFALLHPDKVLKNGTKALLSAVSALLKGEPEHNDNLSRTQTAQILQIRRQLCNLSSHSQN